MKKTSKNVVLLNPRTCGIYNDGGPRFKVDPRTGLRTGHLDNEMDDHISLFLRGYSTPGMTKLPLDKVFEDRVLVPRYYDSRWDEAFDELTAKNHWKITTLGELEDSGTVTIRGGHGSPSNDRRTGHIPYVKVSDIRGLRININPTNLVSQVVAAKFWRGGSSGLRAWDLITPNRASSNIGEFAILLPGEEDVVLTKEVFVIRVVEQREGWSAFYLLWAFALKAVRQQWQRVTLMQTNREDVGKRYREIRLPYPKSRSWADAVSMPFAKYFTTVAKARTTFREELSRSGFEFIASALSFVPTADESIVADDDNE